MAELTLPREITTPSTQAAGPEGHALSETQPANHAELGGHLALARSLRNSAQTGEMRGADGKVILPDSSQFDFGGESSRSSESNEPNEWTQNTELAAQTDWASTVNKDLLKDIFEGKGPDSVDKLLKKHLDKGRYDITTETFENGSDTSLGGSLVSASRWNDSYAAQWQRSLPGRPGNTLTVRRDGSFAVESQNGDKFSEIVDENGVHWGNSEGRNSNDNFTYRYDPEGHVIDLRDARGTEFSFNMDESGDWSSVQTGRQTLTNREANDIEARKGKQGAPGLPQNIKDAIENFDEIRAYQQRASALSSQAFSN
ncbi:MAG: hypothetical protein AB7W16_09205 [Candidatus Obscuribacterales bacterium]